MAQEQVQAQRVQRYDLGEAYFSIKDAPGPFRLVAEEVQSHEDYRKKFIVELTVTPYLNGLRLCNSAAHQNWARISIKIPFEVALKGVTTALGHGIEHPRNVRLLGRFLPGASEQLVHWVDQEKVAPFLAEWQWEAIFNPQGRTGIVFRLPNPLPVEWTC